jgi:DNA polymerase III delta prime subunit
VEGKEYEKKAADLWQKHGEELSPPYTDMTEETRESWIPKPLTTKIFDSAPANALLKTIEEPAGNLTFFFLTKDKEDMIETIVSRTQVIPVLSQNRENIDLSILENFFKAFPPKDYGEAIAYSERLLEVAKENSCTEEDLLIIIQEYMRRLLKANAKDKAISAKIIGNIEKIQQSQDQITNYVNTQAVFDSLMINLIN